MNAAWDVAVVGYGPVGQTLAILLADRGWRVVVFEKQPAPYPLPRAVHYDHEVARILQAAGVATAMAGRTEVADMYEWRNAAGEALLRLASRADGLCGWPEGNMFAQPELERLLDEKARSLPGVTVHRGCEVVGLDAGEGDIHLRLAAPEGGPREAAARFVVGCDGANSFVRQQIGATVTDLGFFYDWLIVDVVPQEPRVWKPLNIQVCDPARPTTLVSGGPGRRRWEFMRLPHESIEELNSEETAWRLLEPWGIRPGNATLERHAVYRFQARCVDEWRRGRVFIAGDAAHQMPPFAGQGMCSGLRDAVNLAWKLDIVLRGMSPEALLDTYTTERAPHVRALIEMSMGLGRVICVPDPEEAAARDASMIPAARDGQVTEAPGSFSLGPGLLRSGDDCAGRLFLQGRVEAGGRSGLFDDVVGRGWTLLGVGGDPAAHLDAATAAYFSSLGGITVQVGGSGPVRDVDGAYERWFDQSGVAVVLQRPDFYLFGAEARLDGSVALVGALRAALSGAGAATGGRA